MTEPMTPEKLREIQEFPDSMGMGHLVREVERCWEQLQAANAVEVKTREERDAFAERIDARDAEHAEMLVHVKHYEQIVQLIAGHQATRDILRSLIARVDATQKGGA